MVILYDSNEAVKCDMPIRLSQMGLPMEHGGDLITDYIINDTIGVERKTINDFLSSKFTPNADGSIHLDRQLTELSTNFEKSYIMIYGNPLEECMKRGISINVYTGTLVSASLKVSPSGVQGQIIPVPLQTDYDFLYAMKCLHSKVEKGDFTRLPKYIKVKPSIEDLKRLSLTVYPGIGPKKADLIIQEYKSTFSFFDTVINFPETIKVKGLSQKIIQSIRNSLI